jgi:hypothetical protein
MEAEDSTTTAANNKQRRILVKLKERLCSGENATGALILDACISAALLLLSYMVLITWMSYGASECPQAPR